MRTAPKKMDDDFLDEAVGEMEKDKDMAGSEYGADMDDKAEGDDETSSEDRMMAAKQIGKALGIQIADPERFAEALKTFIATC